MRVPKLCEAAEHYVNKYDNLESCLKLLQARFGIEFLPYLDIYAHLTPQVFTSAYVKESD